MYLIYKNKIIGICKKTCKKDKLFTEICKKNKPNSLLKIIKHFKGTSKNYHRHAELVSASHHLQGIAGLTP